MLCALTGNETLLKQAALQDKLRSEKCKEENGVFRILMFWVGEQCFYVYL